MPKVCPVCGASYTDNNVFCPTDGSTLRAADAAGDLIGTVIADRYLVTDLLGEGGMGKVFLARHVRLPQQAAIKVLRPAMARDPDAVARFNREAANASRIEHERIARVFDYGESSDGTVYLAMEYVPGRTLKALLAAEGPQKPERAARITRQVADALDAAHRLGIVHRDLKPDNVMVIEDEELGDRCKVVDFGIAKALGAETSEGGLTKTGFVVGTPEFMSPEQLLGGVIDRRSDVYALALLSYQCFTGVLPFDSSTPERAMTARLTEPPQPLRLAVPDVRWPAAMEQVFARGLARSVDDRIGSAGAFASELEAAVLAWSAEREAPAAPTIATPPAGLRAFAPGAESGRGVAGAAGAAASSGGRAESAAAGVAAVGIAAAGAAAAGTAAQVATERPTTSAPQANRTPLVAGGLAVVAAIAVVAFLLRPGGEPDGTPGAISAASQTAPATSATTPAPNDAALASAGDPPGAIDSGVGSGDAPTAAGANASPTPTSSVTRGADGSPEATPIAPQTGRQEANNAPQSVSGASGTSSDRTSSTFSGGDAARRVLDSIRTALDPLTASETDARRGVAALRSLMPRLVTAEDSAWAYLREAEAHFLMSDERSACVALKAATPLARTNGQRGVLATMSGALSVSC